MTRFLLVHGAFGGAWCWGPIAARLNEHQIGIFNEVMVLWVERVETRTLAQLSMTLADLPSARRKQRVVLPATRRQVSPLRFRAIQSHFPKWT